MYQMHDNFSIAMDAREKGIVAIPCHPGTKFPAVRWKEWQTAMPPLDLQRHWFRTRSNIAIITTGMVVFDCDDPAIAKLVIEQCGATPHYLKTPSGGLHLGYRRRMGAALSNQVKIKGMELDIRTDAGLEMIPNSATEQGHYEWLGEGLKLIAELPVARIGWTRERVRKRAAVAKTMPNARDMADMDWMRVRGRLYVDEFKRAESGKNGHTMLFIAARKIVRFANFNREFAWHLLLYYNATKCDPPWDVNNAHDLAALNHKLDDAMRPARR